LLQWHITKRVDESDQNDASNDKLIITTTTIYTATGFCKCYYAEQ